MLQRLLNFLAPPIASAAVESLYRRCVLQARDPLFYEGLGVPDTVDGRFDLLILHVFLVIDTVRAHTLVTQQLFDILFADMDKNLREMGVSDVSIAKKMKVMLAAFYGRAKIYEEALASSDADLTEALKRNIYGKSGATLEDLSKLTSYVRRAHANLAATSEVELLEGKSSFPAILV